MMIEEKEKKISMMTICIVKHLFSTQPDIIRADITDGRCHGDYFLLFLLPVRMCLSTIAFRKKAKVPLDTYFDKFL